MGVRAHGFGHQAGDAATAIIIAEQDYAERVVQVAEGLPTLRTLVYRGERTATNKAKKKM